MSNDAAKMLGVLLGVAKQRATITYEALANLFGMNISWASDRREIGVLLGEVATYGYEEWGVLLPVIAVGKGDNMPSGRKGFEGDGTKGESGFWKWCLDHDFDISNPEKLTLREQAKVYRRFTA